MRKLVLVSLLAFLLLSSSTMAGWMDGQELNFGLKTFLYKDIGDQHWKETRESDNAIGYVRGVSDAYQGWYFTLPDGIKFGTVVAVVEKFLANNPEYWSHSAEYLIAIALSDAWGTPEERERCGWMRQLIGAKNN